MLLSTGSNEIQQLRWNSSLGLVFGADSLKPLSSKCRAMRSSHGAIQPPPDSRNATRKRVTIDDTTPDHIAAARPGSSSICALTIGQGAGLAEGPGRPFVVGDC